MKNNTWANEMNVAITVCDINGNIVYMNEKSRKTFERYGDSLIGKSLKDCHSEKSWEMILHFMNKGLSNSYTIEKHGVKKIIHQTPWYENDTIKGMVEFSIELPSDLPHFVRG